MLDLLHRVLTQYYSSDFLCDAVYLFMQLSAKDRKILLLSKKTLIG